MSFLRSVKVDHRRRRSGSGCPGARLARKPTPWPSPFWNISAIACRRPVFRSSAPMSVNRRCRRRARACTPRTCCTEVSAERLERFFVKEDGHYRIAKEIRDLCLFARQDVTRDPPFSRLDLISCRNLLIYLDDVCPASHPPELPLRTARARHARSRARRERRPVVRAVRAGRQALSAVPSCAQRRWEVDRGGGAQSRVRRRSIRRRPARRFA